jgi:hypothetical protein
VRALIRSPQRSGVLVATKSFTYTDRSGRLQTVKAGQTRVSSDTEDARRFPDAFAPEDGRAIPPRAAVPVSPTTKLYVPVITDVLIDSFARDQLIDYAAISEDGLEIGGFLLGRIERKRINVVRVYRADEDRQTHRVTLRGDMAKIFADQVGLAIVGTWQTHPSHPADDRASVVRNASPSPQDLATFEKYLELDRNPCSANLILSPSDDEHLPWARPNIFTWIARIRDGAIECHRGFLKEVSDLS